MITKKATSTPLNPKSKAWNQGKEDWVQEQYLVFLVKREESRNFDVFFGFFLDFFFFFLGVWKSEKTLRDTKQKGKFQKNVCP